MKPLISAGELIDQSWNAYKTHFSFFLQFSGWLVLVALLNVVGLLLYPNAGAIAFHTTFSTTEVVGVAIYGFSNLVVSPLLGFWVWVSLTIAAKSALQGKPARVTDIMQETAKRYFPALAVTILVALALLFIQFVTLGPSLLVGIVGFMTMNGIVFLVANALLILGLFASLILTSKWTLYYVMAPYASILGLAKNKQALQQSKALTEGKFWSVLFRLALPKIVFILIYLLIAILLTVLFEAIIASGTSYNLDLQQRLLGLSDAIIPVLITILLNPLIFLSDVLLYQSLSEQAA